MTNKLASGVTVTFTPVFGDKFLFVRRQLNDPILAGFWCFPGGKVHVGETLAGAVIRECLEETNLPPTGRAFFVDSYLLGDRVGAHFAVEVAHDNVKLDELHESAWVTQPSELAQFTPRIPGIDNHLHYIFDHLQRTKDTPDLTWHLLDQHDLVSKRFMNQ
jgi:8-oxo-dGTP pyrophosphatase MutT (NUDIX family)